MRIGDLAQATGSAVETIRFYEREGLLPPPVRGANNYRQYRREHVERLAFIRQCRALDMALDEIRDLLSLRDAPGRHCGEVNALLDAHIAHVAERVRELRALQRELQLLRSRCVSPHSVAACGIIQELERAAAKPASARRRRHVAGVH